MKKKENKYNMKIYEENISISNKTYIKNVVVHAQEKLYKVLFSKLPKTKYKRIYETVYDSWAIFNHDNLVGNIEWFNNKYQKINSSRRFEEILEKIHKKLWWIVIGANFKKPANNTFVIDNPSISRYKIEKITKKLMIKDKFFNIWYNDTIFIKNANDFLKEFNEKSLHLVGAVADCAAISWKNYKTNTISLTHAWWQWVVNWVLESLIKEYKVIWNLKDSFFDISPMAGKNYEWEKIDIEWLQKKVKMLRWNYEKIQKTLHILSNYRFENKYVKASLENIFKEYWYSNKDTTSLNASVLSSIFNLKGQIDNTLKLMYFIKRLKEKYNIDLEKDWIFIPHKNNLNKWIFYLDRLIEQILIKLWVPKENIKFATDQNGNRIYTTDLDNSWPSYRIHSLWKKWVISAEHTKKSKNGVVYDSRIIVINSFYKQ